jgi:hypothetical protein
MPARLVAPQALMVDALSWQRDDVVEVIARAMSL